MDAWTQQRQHVADAGRRLVREGLAARTWGNVSCRAEGTHIWITPSGLGYTHMGAEDIVRYDMASGEWEGKRKPSSEKMVHAAAYARFAQVRFVIHTHQDYASALSLAGFAALQMEAEEAEALGGVALAPYGAPGSEALAAQVAAALDTGAHTVLMAHHGALLLGRDAEEAFGRALLLERVCRRNCRGLDTESAPADTALRETLLHAGAKRFAHVGATRAVGAALCCANRGERVFAQLDDMAQMIGAELPTVAAEAALDALAGCDAVLVAGVGALCRADTAEDCESLCLLAEKACIAHLHTKAWGAAETTRLSGVDVELMRRDYRSGYSKRIDGD